MTKLTYYLKFYIKNTKYQLLWLYRDIGIGIMDRATYTLPSELAFLNINRILLVNKFRNPPQNIV